MTCAYSASGSLYRPSISRSASARFMPRRSTRNSTTFSSGATMPVKPPISAAMLVMRGAFIHAELFNRLAGVLDHLGQRFSAAHVIQGQHFEDEILGGDVRAPPPADDHLHRLRHLHANIFGDPGIEHVGGADAEGDAAHRAHMRRVRIRADVHLPGQRVGFQHHGVADALASPCGP